MDMELGHDKVQQPPPYRYGSEAPPDFRPLPTLRSNTFISQRFFNMNLPRMDRCSQRVTRVINREDLALYLRGPEGILSEAKTTMKTGPEMIKNLKIYVLACSLIT